MIETSPNYQIIRFLRRRQTDLRAERCRPVAVDGSRARGDLLGYYETDLRDGTIGYYTRRLDDCLQMAIATCLQVAPHLLPDPRIDQRSQVPFADPERVNAMVWLEFVRWMIRAGVTLMIYPVPPRSERRWIGVVARSGMFEDHCLVMNRGEVLFDPTTSPTVHSRHSKSDVDYGIVLRKE